MSAALYLVRHGRAEAGWDTAVDPGLDEVGRAQAVAMADALAPLGPMPILVSPLRRTVETAAPLERRWGVTATVEPAIGEIPSPTPDLEARLAWLRTAMAGRWADLSADLQAWRDGVIGRLASLDTDTVVVSHFVAINAVLGHLSGDDRVVSASIDNCSITVLDAGEGGLRLRQLGREADTLIR